LLGSEKCLGVFPNGMFVDALGRISEESE
jgi:hypothetical protein